jgi:outer membrane receptor protein involved in Fe transport
MKRFMLSLALMGVSYSACADYLPDSVSNSSSTASTSSLTYSTASIKGETISAPPPIAMTDAPGNGIFVSLARSATPVNALPTTADIVNPRLFKTFNAQNLGEAISRETSVQAFPIGQLGAPLIARLRGEQPLVLIDGRPVAGAALEGPDLSEYPIESIDRIEIVRGGLSSLYGPNAVSGVVNVITKRATYSGEPISHVVYDNASYGRQTYRLDFGSRYGPVDYVFYGNQQWESGFRDNSDARSHNIGGNAGLSMGAAGKLLFDISSYNSNAGVPGTACGPDDPLCSNAPASYLMPNQFNNKSEKLASSPTARRVTDNNYLRTSYLVSLSSQTFLTARLFGSQRKIDFDDAVNPTPSHAWSYDQHENSKGGELQANLPLGFLVGGSFVHDHEDHNDRLVTANSFTHSIENYGLFAQEEFHYNRWTVIPSGRYDHNNQSGESKNPRVQLMFDSIDWLRFSGSAGRSFRTPTMDELYSNTGGALPFAGNPALRPEKAWTYDAGFEVHPESFTFRATYFRANVKDLIQVEPITYSTVVNVGEARRQGAEIQVKHVLNTHFRNSLNYAYLEARGMPSGSDHLVDLALSPRHTANYLATLLLGKRWTIDSTLRFEDSRFSGNDQTGMKMGSQLLWDMRVAYQLRQLEIYLGVNDITDKRYQEQAGYPLPGITAYGGLRLRLWG